MGQRSRTVVITAAVLLTTACGSGREDAARSAATAFAEALQSDDGAAACAVLSAGARSAVETSTGKPCAEGILEEDLPGGTNVPGAEVWGTEAQVRTDADTVFLSRFDNGWKVVAAGCQPQGDGEPYECKVQAG